MRALAAAASLSVGVLLATACGGGGGGGGGGGTPPPVRAAVTGRALDSRGSPIPGAAVSVDAGTSAVTDRTGRFSLQADVGSRTLQVALGGQVSAHRTFAVASAAAMDLGDLRPDAEFLPWYRDADGDGYGVPDDPRVQHDAPAGHVARFDDCDDGAAAVHPGAEERCDGVDDDCDGVVDDGRSRTAFLDGDGDGYGDPLAPAAICDAGPLVVQNGDDCDDYDPAVSPKGTWLLDADGDGFPSATLAGTGCYPPVAGAIPAVAGLPADCDDGRADVGPGNPERHGNGVDDDCDPETPDDPAFPASAMAGRWVVHGLTAGDPGVGQWNGWTEGALVLDADGHVLSAEERYFDQTSSSVPPFPRVDVRPGGAVAVDRITLGLGHLAADARSVAFTYTDPVDGPSLALPQRAAAGAVTDDLSGEWGVQQLVASRDGSTPVWQRGRWTMDRGLGLADLTVGPGGGTLSYLVTAAVQLDGTILRSWPYYSHYTLSPDRRLVVGVGSSDGGAPLLEVALRLGPGYAQADLAGDWVLHVLCAALPPAPSGWARASVRIDADGALTLLAVVASPDGPSLPLEALRVDERGELWAPGLSSLAGQLGAGKSLLAATFATESGSVCLAYGLRRREPAPAVVLDGTGGSAVIGAAGGSVEAAGLDGTTYRLDVPPGAIEGADRTIALRPLAGIERSPLAGALLAGVQLEPEGLRLAKPATLAVQLPVSLAGPAEAFSWPGAGDDEMREAPLDPSGAASGLLTLPVIHFSGSGVRAGACSAACYASKIAAWLRIAAASGLTPNIQAEIRALMTAWLDEVVVPRIEAASDEQSLFGAVDALMDWEGAAQQLGVDSCAAYPNQMAAVRVSFQAALDRIVEQLDARCRAAGNDCQRIEPIVKRLYWEGTVQQVPDFCGVALTLPRLESFCAGKIVETVIELHMRPVAKSGDEGTAVTLVAEPWSAFGPLPAAIPPPPMVWSSDNPEVAQVFSTEPVAAVSLRARGDALIRASTGCVAEYARVHVYGRFNGTWSFTWGRKSFYSQRGPCQYFLETTHPVERGKLFVQLAADEGRALSRLTWTWDMLPAVDLDGPFGGTSATLRGILEDAYYSYSATVGRTCQLRLFPARTADDSPTAAGVCTWSFADGTTGWAGCHGTDEVKGVRIFAE